MRKLFLSALLLSTCFASFSQDFEKKIDLSTDYLVPEIIMPKSPLKVQPLFIGGIDLVETALGQTPAKEWHDFIGVTPDPAKPGEFWISVNHEMVSADAKIGDGGGMTTFKIKQKADGSVEVLPQSLTDGRSGKFFNVDFKNTVGETGMNCGGIVGPDGRIWTAEEWWRQDNKSLTPIADTADFTIGTSTPNGFPGLNGQTIKKFENFNYMVEIDPKESKAIRKQYNWGRQPFEGGAILSDNKTVFLGADDVPGFFTKFVADVPGDFTAGKLYVYKHDATTKWVELNNTTIPNILDIKGQAMAAGATMFCRLEWVAIDPVSGDVFVTETGRDDIGKSWPANGNVAPHHARRASDMGLTGPKDAKYTDYYGRVLKYDIETGEVSVHIEGGPASTTSAGSAPKYYPNIHFSNPDGLNFVTIGSKTFMMICEDLNGVSYNRMPYGMSSPRCELFFLDMAVQNPTFNDLIRITASPNGAEITGVTALPDGKTLLINSQHPEVATDVNDYPYNHSLTFAVSGLEEAILGQKSADVTVPGSNLRVHPNPTTREVHLNTVTDVAIYDMNGNRVGVSRNTSLLDVSDLTPGKYIIKTKEGDTTSLIVQ